MIDAKKLLVNLSYAYGGDYDKIFTAISNKETNIADAKCLDKYTTLVSEDYPVSLKKGFKPPFVLYYCGDLSLLNKPNKVAIVGSRDPKLNCHNVLKRLLKDNDITVICSGETYSEELLTLGWAKNPMILVLPCGMGFNGTQTALVKQVLDKGGLVITEFPEDIAPDMAKFPLRNRIMVGLADKLLVLEAKHNGSAPISINFALVEDKDVFVVPTDISLSDDLDNNSIIYEGATPCYSADQLREAI